MSRHKRPEIRQFNHRNSGTTPELHHKYPDMGWFDGWSSSQSSGGDPLQKLDPKLREFLQREAPVKYAHAQSPHQPTPPKEDAPAASPTAIASAPSPDADRQNPEQPVVPPQSLYQDGRYAHLWKNYKPQSAVEAETKSDHEKLMDVLEAYKERKAQIGKAALENCALEQAEWTECMKSGSVTARMTMCRDAVRKFERCYTLQNVRLSFSWIDRDTESLTVRCRDS